MSAKHEVWRFGNLRSRSHGLELDQELSGGARPRCGVSNAEVYEEVMLSLTGRCTTGAESSTGFEVTLVAS